MPRVLCIWFPRWPIQRLRNAQPELERAELVLFADHSQRPLVTACSPKASRSGISIGQPLAEAKALLPTAAFVSADFAADRSALAQLALDAQRFSPLVGLEDGPLPESLLCDVTGCTHLWKSEERFVEAVRGYWRERKYESRLALAGSPGAAWALARSAATSIVPCGGEAEALAPLSIATLRLPADVLDRLGALGLATVGDVLCLPRETLASRFGLVLPLRLDQVLGLRSETFVCERLKEPIAAVREWEVPVDDRFAVGLVCRQMLQELLAMTERLGLGLQELSGEIWTEADYVTIEVRLVEPTRDERHLVQLIELQLERQTWSGGVIGVRWSVLRLARMEQVQGSWLADDSERDTSRMFLALVDRLSSRLGDQAVLRAEILPDAQPEHAVRLVPWTLSDRPKANPFPLASELSRARPFRLVEPPEPIDVISSIPEGPPVRMRWRGRDSPVARAWGPERIETGWWRTRDVRRDYYRAEWQDGMQVWVFRDRVSGSWHLHGYFE